MANIESVKSYHHLFTEVEDSRLPRKAEWVKKEKKCLISSGDGRLKFSIFNLFHCLSTVASVEGQCLYPL